MNLASTIYIVCIIVSLLVAGCDMAPKCDNSEVLEAVAKDANYYLRENNNWRDDSIIWAMDVKNIKAQGSDKLPECKVTLRVAQDFKGPYEEIPISYKLEKGDSGKVQSGSVVPTGKLIDSPPGTKMSSENRIKYSLDFEAAVKKNETTKAVVASNTKSTQHITARNIVKDRLKTEVRNIVKNAQAAAAGNTDAFALMDEASTNFSSIWEEFKKNCPEESKAPDSIAVYEAWNSVSRSLGTILAGQSTLLNLNEMAKNINNKIPLLQKEYDTVVKTLVEARTPADQVAVAQQQSPLAESIGQSVNKALEGGDDAAMAVDSFRKDIQRFGRVLIGMLDGDKSHGITRVRQAAAVDALNEIADQFAEVNDNADVFLEGYQQLTQIRAEAKSIPTISESLLTAIEQMTSLFSTSPLDETEIQKLNWIFNASKRDDSTIEQLFSIFSTSGPAPLQKTAPIDANTSRKTIYEWAEILKGTNRDAVVRMLGKPNDVAEGDKVAGGAVRFIQYVYQDKVENEHTGKLDNLYITFDWNSTRKISAGGTGKEIDLIFPGY